MRPYPETLDIRVYAGVPKRSSFTTYYNIFSAADASVCYADGLAVKADFDWRQTGPQSWDIVAETAAGEMVLSAGGARLAVAGRVVHEEPEAEYPMLYKRFAEIVRAGVSDVDVAPLRHVADAFMLGRHKFVEPFFD